MSPQLSHRIAEQVPAASTQYHRLILVVGPPRTGKTTALRELAEAHSWPLVSVNLSLSDALMEFTSRHRKLKAPELLGQISKEQDAKVIILDNTEILFDPELRLDPLRLLQGISRHRTVIAAWSGELRGEYLTFADTAHPEFKRYRQPGAIIVTTLPV